MGRAEVDLPRDQYPGLTEDVQVAEGLVAEDVLEGSASSALDAHLVQVASPSGGRCGFQGGRGGVGLRVLAQPAELVAGGGEVTTGAEEKREEGVGGAGAEKEGGG